MESYSQQIIGKRLWHIVQAVCYMLHKGISKQKILTDLHSLLRRGKRAGKALANLIIFHHHHHSSTFYSPRKIQISCSNTPSITNTKRKSKSHHHNTHNYNSATVAKAFDVLNAEISDAVPVEALPSPFLKREDSQVDRKAEEFIRRFYEQLRLQPPQSTVAVAVGMWWGAPEMAGRRLPRIANLLSCVGVGDIVHVTEEETTRSGVRC